MQIVFIPLETVLDAHAVLVQETGGAPNVRDLGLLQSALEMPKAQMFGQFLHPTIFDMAAAYMFHLCQNHAFVDGNKRTSIFVALLFLKVNHHEIKCEDEKLEYLVLLVATGKADKKDISDFFRLHSSIS